VPAGNRLSRLDGGERCALPRETLKPSDISITNGYPEGLAATRWCGRRPRHHP
jgi:hypothetical protein